MIIFRCWNTFNYTTLFNTNTDFKATIITMNCADITQPTTNANFFFFSYDTYQCTQPKITDVFIDQTKRWDSVNTKNVWKTFVTSWENTKLIFSQQTRNFFHGPKKMLCGFNSARNGCNFYVECNDVNHSNDFFILNSFISVSNVICVLQNSTNAYNILEFNYNLYDVLFKANGQVADQIDKFK